MKTISFTALGLITLGLMAATVIEKFHGAETAMADCYHAPWMIALWLISASTALATVIARRRGMTVAVLSIHISLILILAGAGITHFTGEQGHINLSLGSPASTFSLSDGTTSQLPFSITLTDCGTVYRPGTRSASDYYSIVDITGDTALNGARISMNHSLDIRGYRFCQSALGDGHSTLSINHDPWGIGITFGAYGLLFISMIMALADRRGRFRTSLRRLITADMLFFAIANANAETSGPKVLQRPLAKTFGKLYICSDDRIQPLQSFARDFCLCVYGKDSYKGLSPEQVLSGWLFYYDSWKREPIIRLKSRKAREAMDGKSHVSLAELYTGGEYRLQRLLDKSGTADRDLLADDDRVALIASVCTGNALNILPASSADGTLSWHSLADGLPADAGITARREIASMITLIYSDISHGRYRAANTHLTDLRIRQEAMAGNVLPSPTAIKAERLYNYTFCPLLLAVFTFMTGLAALSLFLTGEYACTIHTRQSLFHRLTRRFISAAAWTSFTYTTYIIILRWIIGGHIPLTTGYETMLALGWISMSLAILAGRRIPVMLSTGMIVAGSALLVAMMGSRNPAVGTLMPVLSSRLLSLHVMLVMTSYSLFAITALAGIIGLLSPARSARMALLAETLLTPALFLLGSGIFVGAIWANHSWGRYWGWDPKETWALVTFFIYSLPLHTASFSILSRPRVFLAYLTTSFLSVLMTYLGVNYLMTGLHSYGA